MNKVYMIAYDLKAKGHNYTPLYEAIKRSPKWWHHIRYTWLIVTAETPAQIWTRLAPHITKSDRLLIIEVKGNYKGWLTRKGWEWLSSNLPKTPE